MRRHARGGNQHAEAVLPRLNSKSPGLLRCAVRGIDVRLKGDAQAFQHIGGFPDDRQITVTAHNDAHFSHYSVLLVSRALSARDSTP